MFTSLPDIEKRNAFFLVCHKMAAKTGRLLSENVKARVNDEYVFDALTSLSEEAEAQRHECGLDVAEPVAGC